MLLYVLPGGLRRRRYRVPDRRALLLDHHQPVDDGPAVLRDPQQPGPGHAGVRRRSRSATRAKGDAARPRRAADGAPADDGARAADAPPRAAAEAADPKQQRKQLRRPPSPAATRRHGRSSTSERDDRHRARPSRAPSDRAAEDRDRRVADRRRGRGAPTPDASRGARPRRRRSTGDRLEHEGDIAADYLEELLDIADLDGDLDMDVEGDRAAVSIVGADLQPAGGRATARCSRRCRS